MAYGKFERVGGRETRNIEKYETRMRLRQKLKIEMRNPNSEIAKTIKDLINQGHSEREALNILVKKIKEHLCAEHSS